MPKELKTQSLDDLFKLVEEHKNCKEIFVLFCGAVNDAGESWCSDCVEAQPVVNQAVAKLPDETVFVHCSVGDRPTWKDPQNCFRTNPKTQLKGVPTLMKWGKPERLVEEECKKADLVSMLFED